MLPALRLAPANVIWHHLSINLVPDPSMWQFGSDNLGKRLDIFVMIQWHKCLDQAQAAKFSG